MAYRNMNMEADRNVVASPVYSPQVGPPAARRAASAGAIDTPISARSRSESQSGQMGWGVPAMAIPPPPPGPPPAGSRSQSVQPLDRANVPVISPPTRRPPPSGMSALGPVPPTPADWLDSDTPPPQPNQAPPVPQMPSLTVDTETVESPMSLTESSPSTAGAVSAHPSNVRTDKTILQRRAESRTRHASSGSIDERMQPPQISDIQVPPSAGGLSRKPGMRKITPRSGGRMQLDMADPQDSRNSTPRATPVGKLPMLDTGTPPISPYPVRSGKQISTNGVTPKALPTPPPLTASAASSNPRDSSRPPSSHFPLSRHLAISQTAEGFAAGAVERFQAFTEKEMAAQSDTERVRLFAEFFVNESRIRRERYSSAMRTMGSEVLDLTRDLFRPMASERRASGMSQEPDRPSSSSSRRTDAQPGSAPGSAKLPPSPSGNNAGPAYSSSYQPQLSPILSMSVSENHDGSSRGRPPSRWWETESQGDGSRNFERSKRESKYMGVPKNQWLDEEPSSSNAGSSSQHGSLSDYPPEKVGWHEAEASTPQASRWAGTPIRSSPTPAPYDDSYLDVSRLVTLPPPYPRHHPAVNNNHPELMTIRASVRALSDLTETDTVRQGFNTATAKRRESFATTTAQRQQDFKANLQREVSNGNLGFADAAAIEANAQSDENMKKKELEKGEYEHFQNDVVVPLNKLLLERIANATELSDSLAQNLFQGNEHDADMPQEEGDDKPELLEKLTLLKWVFEAREALHKANYDLLTDRNTRYCEVVMTPYRLSGNTEKLQSAEAFFAEDAAKREFAYANEVLDRSREFRSVVESAVQRGVAIQLSAFWDVAPPLNRLLENIPTEMDGFNVQIPSQEFDENPTYLEHPLQYLYSLLLHAEKSTYQFIESHTNLLCLLHEVREAVVVAKAKFLQTQVEEANGTPIPPREREERAKIMRQQEDRRLSEDLKEKVSTVQDQWQSALGEVMRQVKERTGELLLSTGGWDEALEDNGVGVN